MSADDESDLLDKAKAGDGAAFELLLVPHLPMLFAYSRAICGDYHAAADVVQQTALIALRRLDRFFPEADFAAWLKAIARREALSARRKTVKLTPLVEEVIEAAYADPAPAAVAPQREALAKCLELLPGRSRDVIRAHYFDGLRLLDIAAATKVKLNTVKSLLHRARLSLDDCVRRRLGLEVLP